MDNNDNDERIMEEIIAGGANAFASYTNEKIILNMIGKEASSPMTLHITRKT
jgi:hypothetical protein